MDRILQLFKVQDLRNKVIFIVLLLAVSCVIAAIPVPGVDLLRLKDFLPTINSLV